MVLESPYQGSFFGVIGRPGEVLVYGLRGHVFRSIDGGSSWTPLSTGLQVSITAATVDAKGRYLLFSQAGQMLVRGDDSTRLTLVPQQNLSPSAGATRAPDGSLVLVGSRGARVQNVK